MELLANALVHGKTVTLGDVVRIEGVDPAALKILSALRIGAAPLAGYLEQFSRAEVEAALHAQPATVSVTPEWRGAERVRVSRASTLVSGDALTAAASAYLTRIYGTRYEQMELTTIAQAPDLQLPEGAWSMRPRAAAAVLHQHSTVWMDVLVDGAVYRSVAVSFQVQAWKTVLVAHRAMEEGASLSFVDFELVRRDVASLPEVPAATPDDWRGLRLRGRAREGEVLMKHQVVAADAVRRGDRLTLLLSDRLVQIEIAAVAQEDGDAGAMVRVKPLKGGETMIARVIGAGKVIIEGHY
jgi:flagella basal body P-ring formation protein FlgA